jgi:uncharacterized protein YciI
VSTGRHLVLFYEYVEDVLERREPHRAEHLARIRAAVEEGSMRLAGALGEPPTGGAFVFHDIDEAAIAAFAEGDPYTRAGLVTSWRIVPWTVVASA